MRTFSLILFALCLAFLVGSCKSSDIMTAPSGTTVRACLQCNIICKSGENCPLCKGDFKKTTIGRACPRCGKACGSKCDVCGLDSVPALLYYKCPSCGKTYSCSDDRIMYDRTGAPMCENCKMKTLPQIVPLRGCCPDCKIWSERIAPCPRCGLDMAPM